MFSELGLLHGLEFAYGKSLSVSDEELKDILCILGELVLCIKMKCAADTLDYKIQEPPPDIQRNCRRIMSISEKKNE